MLSFLFGRFKLGVGINLNNLEAIVLLVAAIISAEILLDVAGIGDGAGARDVASVELLASIKLVLCLTMAS